MAVQRKKFAVQLVTQELGEVNRIIEESQATLEKKETKRKCLEAEQIKDQEEFDKVKQQLQQ